jgi:hypothetical protein
MTGKIRVFRLLSPEAESGKYPHHAAIRPAKSSDNHLTMAATCGSPNIRNREPITPDGFEEFWNLYPKKVARPKAIQSFKAAMKKTTLEAMLSSLRNFIRSADWLKDGGQWVPHPTTWLNQERWNDEASGIPEQSVPHQSVATNASYSTYDKLVIAGVVFTSANPPRREQFTVGSEGDGAFETYTTAWQSWMKKRGVK